LKLLDLLLWRTSSRNHLPRTGPARPDIGHEASVGEWLPIHRTLPPERAIHDADVAEQ
jgi:hypothetical protein